MVAGRLELVRNAVRPAPPWPRRRLRRRPVALGAGTNEDVALVVERSQVLLAGDRTEFRVFPEVGSSSLTVRVSSWNQAALVVTSPAAVAKVTGLTPPSGF